MDRRYFSQKIVKWYQHNKRSLPWRNTKDPYKIWLSEIILQQTRVNQGLPYYRSFVETFPSIYDLAKAPEQKILRLWQGLGYYTRARNLHKCAKEIVQLHGGRFPSAFEDLKKLPGIGDYTAAAIASICFNEPTAVVDGNVFRVLSRVFGIDTPINSSAGKSAFQQLANKVIDPKMPAEHNQAIMEFGALHCSPQSPQCGTCPLATGCFANEKDLQGSLPVKERAKAIRKRYFYYFIIKSGSSLMMKKRSGKDIWNGLYDFLLIEKSKSVRPEKVMENDPFLRKLIKQIETKPSKSYRHILSHQHIEAKFTEIRVTKPVKTGEGLKFYSSSKIAQLPKPVLISRYLTDNELL